MKNRGLSPVFTLEPPPKWNGYYSPSCMIDSSYRSGLVIRYVYALNYLSQWEQIDNDLKALFDKFSDEINRGLSPVLLNVGFFYTNGIG